jgi:hypothetical protein
VVSDRDGAPPVTRSLGDWLRLAWAGGDAGCPAPESFLPEELADLTPEQRRLLDAHADRCPACAAERELAAGFVADAAPAADVGWVVERLRAGGGGVAGAEPARPPMGVGGGNGPLADVVPFRGRRVTTWVRLAAAAALVVAVGITFQTLRSPSLPPPPDAGEVRSGLVEPLAPQGELAALPGELRWRPFAGAVRYRVRLQAADGETIWEGEASGPSATLPAEVMGELQRAVAYSWTVEALSATGTSLARSGDVPFRVAPLPEPAPTLTGPSNGKEL